jgi:hypothetical protein
VSPLVLAVVAAAMFDDGGSTAIALDDGTVWRVADAEWEELGACDDGEVTALGGGGGQLEIECGDDTAWTWSAAEGWAPRVVSEATAAVVDPEPGWARSWWPVLELSVRAKRADQPIYEGWVRLRWDL